jgi:hypothetical protein
MPRRVVREGMYLPEGVEVEKVEPAGQGALIVVFSAKTKAALNKVNKLVDSWIEETATQPVKEAKT